MKYKHYEFCEAAICADDPNTNYRDEVIWYPDEEKICKKGPYQKFQKKQKDIHKWFKKGKFQNWDEGYTAHDLETRSI